MNDALSQDDIDKLLNAAGGGDVEADSNVPAAPEDNRRVAGKKYHRIKVYDFKRPDKFSKDQLRTIQMIHETFARLMTTSLSGQLRLLVQVHIVAVEQLTYEEFVRSISNPSTMAIVNMDPLKGSAILEIDPSITFIIIDRMFGGIGHPLNVNRELTDIETTAIETIILRSLNNLREAWSNVVDLRPRLGNIETNPQFAQVVPPSEMVVLITFEIKIGEYEGSMNLCIPYLTIEPIINKLSAQFWYSSVNRGISEKNYKLLKNSLLDASTRAFAEIGETNITVQDAMNLEAGDIIRLPGHKINKEILLKIGKKPKFKVVPGLSGSKLAVQVIDTYEKIPTIDDIIGKGEM